jgi:hypothetical protein
LDVASGTTVERSDRSLDAALDVGAALVAEFALELVICCEVARGW